MIQADFHIHTTASDGHTSPQDIVSQAVKAGLTHIAITDHDTVDGLLRLGDYSKSPTITVISGIEINTDMPGCEIHILGYGIDINHFHLQQQLAVLRDDRLARIQRMVMKITELGYPINAEQILAVAKGAAIGRPHVAKVLVEKGYFPSVAEAFHTLLNYDKPGYVPHYKMAPNDVITLIHQAGGVAVLAHPGLVGNDKQVYSIIEAGIDGLEVYHPQHDGVAIAKYFAIAQKYDLLISGGSDYHAISGRFPEKLGEFGMPENIAKTFIDRIIRCHE